MTAARDLTVDIVVNNFNYGRFLPLAIASACDQTHEKVNVIVVDDGSTDDSRDLLEEAPEGVEVILKENGGQASAMNVGLSHCHGDIVMFLDSTMSCARMRRRGWRRSSPPIPRSRRCRPGWK